MVPPPLPVSDGSPPVVGEVQPQPVPADRGGGAGLDAGHLQEEHDRRAEEKDKGEEERENKGLTEAGGAKSDHFKLGVRTCVRAHLNLDVQGACVRPKKRSQLTPCLSNKFPP